MSTPFKRSFAPGLLLGLILLSGCAKDGASPLTTNSKSAPAPADLSPTDKKKYEEAIKNAGPMASPPTTK